MTLIGHVLSPATKFEDRDAVDQQWYPVVSAFCAEKGIIVNRTVGRPKRPKSRGRYSAGGGPA